MDYRLLEAPFRLENRCKGGGGIPAKEVPGTKAFFPSRYYLYCFTEQKRKGDNVLIITHARKFVAVDVHIIPGPHARVVPSIYTTKTGLLPPLAYPPSMNNCVQR